MIVDMVVGRIVDMDVVERYMVWPRHTSFHAVTTRTYTPCIVNVDLMCASSAILNVPRAGKGGCWWAAKFIDAPLPCSQPRTP